MYDNTPIPPLFDDALAERLPKFKYDPEPDTVAAKQRRWEHRVVGLLLKHYGLVREWPDMVALAKAKTGHGRLTLEAFFLNHPTFPVWLAGEKVPWVFRTSMSDFAKGFLKTKIYKAFAVAEEMAPPDCQGSRVGLVFEWLKVWPTAIIHNYYHAIRSKDLVIFYHVPSTDEVMAIQSFDSFLSSMPWSP